MRSIRLQLLVGLLVAIMGLALLEAAWSYRDTYHETEEIFDAHLAQYARIVHNLLANDIPEPPALPLVWPLPPEADEYGHRYERKLNFQVWRGESLLAYSAAAPPDRSYAPLSPGYSTIRLGSDAWRVFNLPDPDHGLMIQVAERGDVRGEMAELIARRTLGKSLTLIPLTALLIVWLVGRGLAPLSALDREIAGRSARRLHPLSLGALPTELQPIVATINNLMARLEQALAQERRFTSDATHELRTPLGLMRLQIEAINRATTAAEREEAQTRLLRGLDRLSRTVTQMLQLARLEQAPGTLPLSTLDLKAAVVAQIAELAPIALGKNQELGLDGRMALVPCKVRPKHWRSCCAICWTTPSATRPKVGASMCRFKPTARIGCWSSRTMDPAFPRACASGSGNVFSAAGAGRTGLGLGAVHCASGAGSASRQSIAGHGCRWAGTAGRNPAAPGLSAGAGIDSGR